MRALFASALDAFREGRGAPWSPPTPDAPHSDQYVLSRLPALDRVALANVAQPRETALALARAGRQQDARSSMDLAAFLQSVSRFSTDGRAYARTLHDAAESYLAFRNGNHSEARARMVAALQATDQLAASWGDSEFIARRRVHLAHNLMRVDVARAASREAMRFGARVLECIAGVAVDEGGPLSEWRVPVAASLDHCSAQLYFDLVTQTAAELLVPLPSPEAREALAYTSRLRAVDIRRPWRGWEWLIVKHAAVEGDARRFLSAAQPLLGAGRMKTPVLWYATALDLARMYGAVEPAGNAAAVDEIFAELETAARVPACMRPSRSRQAA